MLSNRIALVALGVGCLGAAAGGGYLATRHNAAQVAPLEAARSEPVHETEAVVEPAAEPVPVEAVAEPAPAPATMVQPAPPRARPAPARRQAPAPTRRTEARGAPAQLPTLERSWPSSNDAPEPVEREPLPATPPAPLVEERAAVPEPPRRVFEELVVPADSVIGLQLETAVSSDRARVEDSVEARVVRDVRAGGEVAIPEGARALGVVTVVEEGGKFKERARLGIRFHTLVLSDGTRLPISTETMYRYGDSPSNESAAKIGGGAVAGAILGAILGGAKGAAVGATSGAGAGTAAVMAGGRNAATFPAGTETTARILSPVVVTIER